MALISIFDSFILIITLFHIIGFPAVFLFIMVLIDAIIILFLIFRNMQSLMDISDFIFFVGTDVSYSRALSWAL